MEIRSAVAATLVAGLALLAGCVGNKATQTIARNTSTNTIIQAMNWYGDKILGKASSNPEYRTIPPITYEEYAAGKH